MFGVCVPGGWLQGGFGWFGMVVDLNRRLKEVFKKNLVLAIEMGFLIWEFPIV